MKTPEEIRKGLEACGWRKKRKCTVCPYWEHGIDCVGEVMRDALSYIEQLEAERDD